MSRILKFFFLFLFTLKAHAVLSDDREQKLHIKADSTTLNYKTGVTLYEGHVIIDQGTSHLLADRLITKRNAQHKIEEAIAYGFKNLAEYRTTLKSGDETLLAKANVIKFYPLKSLAILEGNALVTQGKNSFQGPHIIYHINEQTIIAPSSKEGRATLIIDPNQIS